MKTTTWYKDDAGEWRWKTIHSNGNETGASTEGYVNRSDALDNFFDDHPQVEATGGLVFDDDGGCHVEY